MMTADMGDSQDQKAEELHIVVAVLTYRRPEGISKLLEVLRDQHHSVERPYRMTVVVVDNDAAGSGRAVVEPYGNTDTYKLIYVVEPHQGIPLARNCALDAAPADTDLFCFLDDDEWPVDGWLDSMLSTREQTGADCVYGPVEPVFPSDPPQYFIDSRVFERRRNAEGAQIHYAASNNVMFDYRKFAELGIRFEEKLRFTGGSDHLFFNKADRAGIKIFWSDNALVYDIIPLNRMTWKWLLQRQYRLGNTLALRDVLYGTMADRARRLGYGVLRMGLGVAMLPAFPFSPHIGMKAITHVMRGAGAVSGVVGFSYKEYSPVKLGAEPGA